MSISYTPTTIIIYSLWIAKYVVVMIVISCWVFVCSFVWITIRWMWRISLCPFLLWLCLGLSFCYIKFKVYNSNLIYYYFDNLFDSFIFIVFIHLNNNTSAISIFYYSFIISLSYLTNSTYILNILFLDYLSKFK